MCVARRVGLCTSSEKKDRQTDRRDRPDQTRTRPEPNRPTPETPRQSHRHCTGKHAPGARPQNPSYLKTIDGRQEKRRVCPVLVVVVSKRNHRPLPPGAGQKPVPHLYPYSVGWEARRPLEPHSQPRRGRGITCKRNVWPRTQKQRPRDKRVRAEDLKSLVVLGDEASHKGEKKRKRHQKTERKQRHPDP